MVMFTINVALLWKDVWYVTILFYLYVCIIALYFNFAILCQNSICSYELLLLKDSGQISNFHY